MFTKKMKDSIKIGLGFGLTSGVITTLGLIVGLFSGTHSKLVVIGGILTIAIADAFSDALGIHVSQESEKRNSERNVWESTLWTFLSKFILALTFFIPVLLFDLNTAVIISIIWGLIVLVVYNYRIALYREMKPLRMILEHVFIAVLVIVITYFVGKLVNLIFV
jgi:VIT1/CCC1 family predicted Fe2+/Mn2+ transporter